METALHATKLMCLVSFFHIFVFHFVVSRSQRFIDCNHCICPRIFFICVCL